MDFLSDYWLCHSAYEIPESYALWSGIALLGASIHRRVTYLHGSLEMTGTVYVGLIGNPGNSKSTCCDFARDVFHEVYPNARIGPSRTSPEMLVKLMAEDDSTRVFTNHLNEQIEVRPYAFFINEFQNFLGRSPFDMIALLTDIYDRKAYDGSTLVRGVEYITNPAVNVLMCAPPDWFISNVKGTLISGGIARRFVLVYDTHGTDAKPFIYETKEILDARSRVKQRLSEVQAISGAYKWGDGVGLYEAWYNENFSRRRRETNKVMQGYLKSKNVQLYKIMMLLDVVSDKPMFLFSRDLVIRAAELLRLVEPNMLVLATGAGRSETTVAQQKIFELLRINDGWMPEKKLLREVENEFKNPSESFNVFRHLENTDQVIKKIFEVPNSEGQLIQRWMICLPEKYREMMKKGDVEVKKKEPNQ